MDQKKCDSFYFKKLIKLEFLDDLSKDLTLDLTLASN